MKRPFQYINVCLECGELFPAKSKRKTCCTDKCYRIRTGFCEALPLEKKCNICLKCDKPFMTFKDRRICPSCTAENKNLLMACTETALVGDRGAI